MMRDSKHRLRCIAFDAVGTLIEPTPPAAEAYYRVAMQHGSRLAADEIARRFRRAFHEVPWRPGADDDERFVTSEAIEADRWRRIVATVIDDVPDNEACFHELFAHFARPAAWRLFDDAAATLERAARSGVRVAIASNFDRRLRAVCDAFPALEVVSCRVISSEVGWRKPSPGFFAALARIAECRPEEILMVGDDRENDVEGACRAGMGGVLLDRRGRGDKGEIASLHELEIPAVGERRP